MMAATLDQLAEAHGEREYVFAKILATKMNDNKSTHGAIKCMMDAVFP